MKTNMRGRLVISIGRVLPAIAAHKHCDQKGTRRMCGIAGVVGLKDSRADVAAVNKRTAVLARRGPDDEGLSAWYGAVPDHRGDLPSWILAQPKTSHCSLPTEQLELLSMVRFITFVSYA